jgi:hypothetical protein
MIEQMPIAVLTFATGALLEPMISALRRFGVRGRICPTQALNLTDAVSVQVSPVTDERGESDPVITSPAPKPRRIDLCERTASEHAHALLGWLQEPGGLTGEVAVAHLQDIHRDLCSHYGWAERSWISVGRELRKILGQQRTYGTRGGQKVRVYRIPTVVRSVERAPLRKVA